MGRRGQGYTKAAMSRAPCVVLWAVALAVGHAGASMAGTPAHGGDPLDDRILVAVREAAGRPLPAIQRLG